MTTLIASSPMINNMSVNDAEISIEDMDISIPRDGSETVARSVAYIAFTEELEEPVEHPVDDELDDMLFDFTIKAELGLVSLSDVWDIYVPSKTYGHDTELTLKKTTQIYSITPEKHSEFKSRITRDLLCDLTNENLMIEHVKMFDIFDAFDNLTDDEKDRQRPSFEKKYGFRDIIRRRNYLECKINAMKSQPCEHANYLTTLSASDIKKIEDEKVKMSSVHYKLISYLLHKDKFLRSFDGEYFEEGDTFAVYSGHLSMNNKDNIRYFEKISPNIIKQLCKYISHNAFNKPEDYTKHIATAVRAIELLSSSTEAIIRFSKSFAIELSDVVGSLNPSESDIAYWKSMGQKSFQQEEKGGYIPKNAYIPSGGYASKGKMNWDSVCK